MDKNKKIIEILKNFGELSENIKTCSNDVEHKEYRDSLFSELSAVIKELNLYSDEEIKYALFENEHSEIKSKMKIECHEVKPKKKDDDFFLILLLLILFNGKEFKEFRNFLLISAGYLFMTGDDNEKRIKI